MISFIQAAHAADNVATGNMFAQLAMPLVFVAVFYFFIIRPQNKRNKEHKVMIDSLSEGTEVIFAGGLMGVIESIDGDYAVISLNKNNQIKIQRASIISTLPKGTLDSLS